MTVTADWNHERQLWIITSGQLLGLEELFELLGKTDWGNGGNVLWDLRAMTKGPDSPGELRLAASMTRSGPAAWRGGRTAIVVSRDFDYGIARMFQAFTDGSGIEYSVFREIGLAMEWLGGGPP
jgi:hypothetical protein